MKPIMKWIIQHVTNVTSYTKFHDIIFSDSSSSFLENLFGDWVKRGTVIRLDIRHWLHRWDAVVIKQSHAKYGAFMSSMAGAVLAYNKADMMLLVQAVKLGNKELYDRYTDEEMMAFLKPQQVRSYVRRITRGVGVSVVFIFIHRFMDSTVSVRSSFENKCV